LAQDKNFHSVVKGMDEMESHQDEIEALRRELESVFHKFTVLDEDNTKLIEEHNKLDQDHTKLIKDHTKLIKDHTKLTKDIDNLDEALANASTLITNLKNERRELALKLLELQTRESESDFQDIRENTNGKSQPKGKAPKGNAKCYSKGKGNSMAYGKPLTRNQKVEEQWRKDWPQIERSPDELNQMIDAAEYLVKSRVFNFTEQMDSCLWNLLQVIHATEKAKYNISSKSQLFGSTLHFTARVFYGFIWHAFHDKSYIESTESEAIIMYLRRNKGSPEFNGIMKLGSDIEISDRRNKCQK
jgi:DNA repair exonuclease SbcCD ATPase subunit